MALRTRRSLLAVTAAAGLGAACRIATPGVTTRSHRIGMLSTGTARGPDEAPYTSFREGMRAEGYFDVWPTPPQVTSHTNYAVHYRFGNGDYVQVVKLAKELVDLGADIIV